MEIFPKFIIEDGCLIIQKVTFHKDIVTDPTKVTGGGWFKFISEDSSFNFYGKSEDFGKATFEKIKECIQNKQVYKYKGKMLEISEDYDFYYYDDNWNRTKLN